MLRVHAQLKEVPGIRYHQRLIIGVSLESSEVVDERVLDRLEGAAVHLDRETAIDSRTLTTIESRYGRPRSASNWHSSRRWRWSPLDHSTKVNGPVQTSVVCASGPSSETRSTMLKISSASKMPGRGVYDVRVTVYLSAGVVDGAETSCSCPRESACRTFGSPAGGASCILTSSLRSAPGRSET